MTCSTTSPAFPNPDNIVQATLDNGLRVFVRENPNSLSTVVSGRLPGGAVREPAGQAGLAAMTASMLMRGTQKRSFDQINDEVESVGASLSLYAGRHAVAINAKALAEDLDLLLDLLGDVLQRPTFPAEQVERVRGQRLTSLQERDNDTRSVASLLFRKLAYPAAHPYSRPIGGYQETIKAFGQQDLVGFYNQTYGPAGGVLVIVGAVQADKALAQVEKILGGWRQQPAAALPLPPVTFPAAIVREEKVLEGKTQSDIVLGTPSLRRSDPDFYAARLANSVLGRFGMMGRLGENVREQLGLAYYSYSSLEANWEPGPWMVAAGVDPTNVERCLAAVNDELDRIGAELVSTEELEDSKAHLTCSLPLELETNEGVARSILNMAWHDLGLDYLLRYGDLIDSVTAEQLRAVASRYLRSQAYALAIAGPALKA